MTEPSLSPLRRGVALFALAFGGFGIGVTEFATMGLLPDIAGELIPGFEQAPDRVIAQAGVLITVYALGVVVGAPTFAVLAARMSQTRLAFWLLGLFIVGTVASACMPTFGSLALFRFVAALPHGAYFGVASLLAARIMGPGKRGRGIALALSGLTIANVVGVPLATWMGQLLGWRSAYVLVAVIFATTLLLSMLALPRYPGNPERSPLRELSALRNPRIWVMIAVGSVGFGGFFAVYSYIAEVTTRETGLSPAMVPWVLACLGVGMTIGNLIGGWATDRDPRRTVTWGFIGFIIVLVLYTQLAWHPVGLFACGFMLGVTSSMLIPSIQSRLIRISDEAALLGAAVNHAAFNIGNSLGAWLGGIVIAGGFGYLAPGWVGAALAVVGLGLVAVSNTVERRDKARGLNTVGISVVE
ncbi:arabinose ABC transporter permease [Leucobacter sp. UCD-THU]|uniref:MFS transporter n=1 Tax=Leucobacter sp. UCD-THU TaxID=1292023 RepID=UPI00036CA32E|nr:MFS transporter [Leucobacter sp. UCD-THU]EYT52542.1 arabinose ABC transporter permease [Leucobacter sp. UCD-THU]